MPTTYKQLQKTRLKIKSALVSLRCGVLLFTYCCIHGANPKDIWFQVPLQLCAKLLAIFQLTIGILGVLRRQCVPLATDAHRGMVFINGINSNNDNKSNSTSNNNNVGHPKLAQSCTYLRLAQDKGM